MSKPREDWWGNVIRMVRNYPARRGEYNELMRQSLSVASSGMPGGGNASRVTENVAIRQMAPMKQAEYDAVTRAIETTRLLPCGDKRVELITRMYWKGKKLNIEQVIYQIGITEATGKRWHGAFIRLVAEYVGYIN